MIQVIIDNNMWDFFYKNNIDISEVFSREKYSLFVCQHGLYEIEQGKSNTEFYNFAMSHINEGIVKVKALFGTLDHNVPDQHQRRQGFGLGVLGSRLNADLNAKILEKHSIGGKRKSTMIMNKDETDIELGSLSATYYVLTQDKKNGPLRTAQELGGKVIFIDEVQGDTALDKLINIRSLMC
ncbi:hypothetical protein GWZ48_002320 [Vibrio fluvialis]|nr:hypothetical protein [Vibrio fluvialis]